MIHLSPEAFIDVLDGTVAESEVSHLASCQACRLRLEELRETWAAAADTDMPEPSPLFWDHLSARVRDAVAEEEVSRPPLWQLGWSWRVAGPLAGVAAALAIALALPLTRSSVADVEFARTPSTPTTLEPLQPEPLPQVTEDEPLRFVADLASHLDWDGVSELGLANSGGAERIVADMDDVERDELQRLLREALGGGV